MWAFLAWSASARSAGIGLGDQPGGKKQCGQKETAVNGDEKGTSFPVGVMLHATFLLLGRLARQDLHVKKKLTSKVAAR